MGARSRLFGHAELAPSPRRGEGCGEGEGAFGGVSAVSRIGAIPLLLASLLLPLPATAAEDGLDVAIGKALFERPWVPAPSSTRANDGLGPLFDARSCSACHLGAGRGATAVNAEGRPEGLGLVLSLFQPDGGPDPVYGHRLETMTLPGVPAEGTIGVADEKRRRVPRADDPGYGPLDPATHISLRSAPDLRGRGRLERVDDAAILALEDPQDRDGDGVRGRARRLDHAEGGSMIGRFGWKASHADLASQTSEAFALDLGLSTPLRPEPWGDCTDAQTACRNAPHGREAEGEPEISDAIVSRIVTYLRSLKVPASEPDRRGEKLFAATGCATCHRPSLPTRDGASLALFTDVLLHDMGEGLADSSGVPGADAAEWRTAPLAGLSRSLARAQGLLHDGRAATVAEAVRWHDGEAAGARARFEALDDRQRRLLLDYVSSL
ncbi:di-heme oxidoredictase family protein [Ancylobacter radicis]|uniref:Thiol oxidoreductase n=1 Tax=Ancylobacter radicis TaxID=2836179 RepID=A0ABS5R9Q6_9HYPH|nr:di-heme oxidoredictase family protein [Ancylobacter radicis]MBS9477857.1 thiol oxidoreductase [Ancylobacter radicis]